VHLQLVVPHRFYRAAPDLSRPELRDAYEQGRADRLADKWDEEVRSRTDVLRAGGPEVRRAYLLGVAPEHASAPAPLALTLSVIAASTWLSAVIEHRTGLRGRLSPVSGLVLLTVLSGPGLGHAGKRRAQALGLSVETAPVAYMSWSALMQLAIWAVHDLSDRIRRGSGDPTPTSTAAALVVRELMLRRSWRDAMRASRSGALTS
jgi:hypothetical protein